MRANSIWQAAKNNGGAIWLSIVRPVCQCGAQSWAVAVPRPFGRVIDVKCPLCGRISTAVLPPTRIPAI